MKKCKFDDKCKFAYRCRFANKGKQCMFTEQLDVALIISNNNGEEKEETVQVVNAFDHKEVIETITLNYFDMTVKTIERSIKKHFEEYYDDYNICDVFFKNFKERRITLGYTWR